MKKILMIAILSLFFCQTAYAGEWKTDETGTRYVQNDGTFATGWYQDIDGVWYFLDNNTGYLLTNTTTPDGYLVDSSGAWMRDAAVDNRTINYENVVETNITTLANPIGYLVPLKVYYNNTYNNPFGGSINILGVEVSKEGAPYISLSPIDVDGYGGVVQKYKLTLSDGTVVEKERLILDYAKNLSAGSPMLRGPDISDVFERNTVILAEVWIAEYIPPSQNE